jgi:crotonobetainyl-CoA:carnitine CoA-transferase CaiB-like acyl-CoA transferase
MLCKLDFQAARYTMTGEVPSQEGNNHPTLSPMGVFDSADGHVNLAASTDKMFRVFCEIMQADELAANPDYESVEGRLAHREALWHQVNLLTRRHPTRDLVKLLNSVGIPCGPINTIEQAFEDEQVKFLAVTKQACHRELGNIDLIRSPINLSRYSHGLKFDRAGPDLGEHSVEILRQLDYSDGRIESLLRSGTVIAGTGATEAESIEGERKE